jgi:DNA-binding MarR family transcriptional regulator
LSWSESSALAQLVRDGPATSAELARFEGISPQSMGATLKGLEDAGLVVRGTDPEDGRRVVLSATNGGRHYYKESLDARAQQMVEALLDEFTSTEIEQLLAVTPLLDRLAARIHADAGRPSAASAQHGRDADI